MMKWRQVAACTLITLWLAGCTSDNSSAPISSVNGGGNDRMLSNAGNNNGGAQTGDGGRIIYNRSYQNIPKGSYNGGTYTVKRGDTLFYIAWISGNDFRDLAEKQHSSPLQPQCWPNY